MDSDTGVACVRCKAPAEWVGHIPVVVGGSSSGAKLLFGQLAELNERNWVIDVYRCARCGHLEMFDRTVAMPPPVT